MKLKEYFVGRKFLQPFFERLYRISLRGMNYGLGGIITSSGEENLIRTVKQWLSKSGISSCIVFDVGANNGDYAKALRVEFPPEDVIYCFEPSHHSFQALRRNLEGYTNIELIGKGLGVVAERRKLFFDTEGSGWASVFERHETGFNHVLNESEEIEIIVLDEFCASQGIDRIHFIKMDVEGFELEILRGSVRMLPKIDFIQFEFSFANYNSKTYLYDFFQILSDFRIYRVLKDGLEEIEYDPRYEVLMTTNYLAVNKRLDF